MPRRKSAGRAGIRRLTSGRAGIRRLKSGGPAFTRSLRDALRESSPGEIVVIHAENCPMGDECTCDALRMIVGAQA